VILLHPHPDPPRTDLLSLLGATSLSWAERQGPSLLAGLLPPVTEQGFALQDEQKLLKSHFTCLSVTAPWTWQCLVLI